MNSEVTNKLLKMLHPMAGKTGLFKTAKKMDFDYEGATVSRGILYVFKDGILVSQFEYSVEKDSIETNKKSYETALRKAMDTIKVLAEYDEIIEQ